MASGSLKAILYALGANTSIAIAKTIAALATHSGSMMAEAIHSYADCANQGLLLLGMKQAKRPQTDDHPLGHGREMVDAIYVVEARMQEKWTNAKWVFFEPDVK